ncbi:MAG: thioredoxin family protein [Cyclobacteriaceae bacterium]|nr:thioredoxin family protein [Cyclobacteriaceae bacterium]MCH8517398.1 thioredoxin family protein [Cyclobacteriaceae bacterium]
MKELSEDNLQELVSANKKVMVQYGAGWCGNCKITKPKFRKLGEETEGVEFFYVDAEKLPNSRSLADVANLPTFAGFVDGKLVAQKTGNKVEVIKEVIDEVTNH